MQASPPAFPHKAVYRHLSSPLPSIPILIKLYTLHTSNLLSPSSFFSTISSPAQPSHPTPSYSISNYFSTQPHLPSISLPSLLPSPRALSSLPYFYALSFSPLFTLLTSHSFPLLLSTNPSPHIPATLIAKSSVPCPSPDLKFTIAQESLFAREKDGKIFGRGDAWEERWRTIEEIRGEGDDGMV